MNCHTKNRIHDISSISNRYGVGGIVVKTDSIDGIKYRYKCGSVENIDRFMLSENSSCMTRQELIDSKRFFEFQDGNNVDVDMKYLDELFVNMVLTGKSCEEIQGGGCGKFY